MMSILKQYLVNRKKRFVDLSGFEKCATIALLKLNSKDIFDGISQ